MVVRPHPDTTVGIATDCVLDPQETGTGLRNESTLSWAGLTQVRDACRELPHITVEKAVSSGPTALGNGQHQVSYTITVTNDGVGAGAYTLTDQLAFGENVSVLSGALVNTAPGNVAINAGWNGRADTVVAMGVPLATGEVHTYEVTVVVTVATTTNSAVTDCTLESGESGTGLLNNVTVNQNGTVRTDLACAEVQPPPPGPGPDPTPPPPTTVPPTPPITGEIPATGGNSTLLTGVALALVALGGLTVLVTRRRRRFDTVH